MAALALPACSALIALSYRLFPCPKSPNCVSGQADNPSNQVEPLVFVKEPEAALARLRGLLTGRKRCTLAVDQPPHLRAELRSRLFGFMDDVVVALA
jgi:uncharacterized protein (DUF1499 family)